MLRTHSLGFQWSIHKQKPVVQDQKHILIVGCGDTMPYIIRHLEPGHHKIYALDLSKHNLERAKLRLWRTLRSVTFIQSDLIHFARTSSLRFDHIDCYGVLHHTANPLKAIELISGLLKPYATLRLMVYNSNARQWIYHISRAFSLLGLSVFRKPDITNAIRILDLISKSNPIMHDRLYASGILKTIHIPRIADTFFHPREARLDLKSYLHALEINNISINGLWDRYGELDDLANPLWTAPSATSLSDRALDLRFENNLELFCHKQHGSKPEDLSIPMLKYSHYLKLITKQPPRHWFSFDETRDLPWQTKYLIWKIHLDTLYNGHSTYLDQLLNPLGIRTLQRLARTGAILPIQAMSSKLRKRLWEPIHSSMEPLYEDRQQNEISAELENLILTILREKKRPMKNFEFIKERLKRSGY
jgi:SAM-dependent methyltransferase